MRYFLSFRSCTSLKIFRNAVCVYALILFFAYYLRKRVCIHTRNINTECNIVITPGTGAKLAASRLCLVTEAAYNVHIVLALRLAGITAGYYLKLLHFSFSA